VDAQEFKPRVQNSGFKGRLFKKYYHKFIFQDRWKPLCEKQITEDSVLYHLILVKNKDNIRTRETEENLYNETFRVLNIFRS
jgi:hypothetical protein